MKVIAISGVARSGKDTFCNYALEFLAQKKITAQRKSFADAIKRDVGPLCLQKIGINPYTTNTEEKSIIRPLLVAYGTDIMRKLDEDWWIERLDEDLEVCRELNITPIITDVRYPNEITWLKEKLNGVLVHVTKYGTKPPNKEEKINNPILKDSADYKIRWHAHGDDEIIKCRKPVRAIMRKIHKDYLSNPHETRQHH